MIHCTKEFVPKKFMHNKNYPYMLKGNLTDGKILKIITTRTINIPNKLKFQLICCEVRICVFFKYRNKDKFKTGNSNKQAIVFVKKQGFELLFM
jgi:hypothetical protein